MIKNQQCKNCENVTCVHHPMKDHVGACDLGWMPTDDFRPVAQMNAEIRMEDQIKYSDAASQPTWHRYDGKGWVDTTILPAEFQVDAVKQRILQEPFADDIKQDALKQIDQYRRLEPHEHLWCNTCKYGAEWEGEVYMCKSLSYRDTVEGWLRKNGDTEWAGTGCTARSIKSSCPVHSPKHIVEHIEILKQHEYLATSKNPAQAGRRRSDGTAARCLQDRNGSNKGRV